MSRVEELSRKIRETNLKLQERQRDVEHWLKELRLLNEELMKENRRAQEDAKHASMKKVA